MSKFVLLILVFVSSVCFADMRVQTLISAVVEADTGSPVNALASKKAFHAVGVVGADAGSATIVIEASNVNSEVDGDWLELGTITLTLGLTSVGDGFANDAPWKYVRARVSDVTCSGDCEDPVISVYMGSEQ